MLPVAAWEVWRHPPAALETHSPLLSEPTRWGAKGRLQRLLMIGDAGLARVTLKVRRAVGHLGLAAPWLGPGAVQG